MAPYDKSSKVYFAAFDVEYPCDDIAYISVNLGNSLITDLPSSTANLADIETRLLSLKVTV